VTRVPLVLGLGRRAGASTVAAALHATALPTLVACGPGSWSADVAVCAGDEASLCRADALRGPAVLLVVLVADTTPPTPARRQELARRHPSVVVLPHVPEWTGLSGVPDEADALFARRPELLPPALRAYTRGLRLAVAALLRADVLARPQPPALTWSAPSAGTPPTTGTAPTTARPRPAVPGSAGATPTLVPDDDAIEAEVLAAATPRTERSTAARPTSQANDADRAPTGAVALGRPATHLRIRALHRPVVGDSAKAG